MRFPILPDTGPEPANNSTLRYDRTSKRWVDGPIVDAAAVAAMQSTLDDYQAGQDATDTALASLITADGSATQAAGDTRWGGGLGVYNAKEHGAKGDGTTNDQPALQALVGTVAAAGGGTIYLPTGRYIVETPGIKWASNVSLVGDGIGKSVLAGRGDLVDIIWNFDGGSTMGEPTGVPLEDVTFAHFELDNSALTHTEPSVSGKGIFILYMRRARFVDLYIHDTIGTGLGCDFLEDTVIDRVVAENCGRNFDGTGITVGQSGIGVGTNWKAVESLTISNCHVLRNGNHGLFVEIQPFPADQTRWPVGTRFTNIYAEGNKIGIANKGSGGVTFVGCEAVNNTQAGFHSVYNNEGDVFVGCKAHGNKVGFHVENSRGDVTLTGCESFGNTENGVLVVNGNLATWETTNINISSSTIRDNGHGGVKVDGFNNHIRTVKITDNLLVDNGKAQAGFQRQGVVLRGNLSDVLVTGNWIGNTRGGTAFQQYGVEVQGATLETVAVMNNLFCGNGTAGYAVTSGTVTNPDVRDNAGARTRTSGSGTILNGSATATVIHGLPTNPTRVYVSPRGDANVWPTTLGTSGVIYTRTGTTGDLAFDWIAEI